MAIINDAQSKHKLSTIEWLKKIWLKAILTIAAIWLLITLFFYVLGQYGSIRFAYADANGSTEHSCIPNAYVFWVSKIKDDTVINRNDLVAFKTANVGGYDNGTLFVKYVRGVPGDFVEIKPHTGTFVNDVFLSNSFFHADKFVGGRDAMAVKGKITPNRYWVMGTGEQSYDSRYWGTIDRSQIIGKATILW